MKLFKLKNKKKLEFLFKNIYKYKIGVSVLIIFVVALLVILENKFISFGNNIVFSDVILMFILINVNIIILMLLMLLVFRQVIKLLYDRKRKVIGTKLRTRIVVSFVFLSLLPTFIFLSPIKLVNNSIESWFSKPILDVLENSASLCHSFENYLKQNQEMVLEHIFSCIKTRRLYKIDRKNELHRYLELIKQNYGFETVSVYSEKLDQLGILTSISNTPIDSVLRDQLKINIPREDNVVKVVLIYKDNLVYSIGTVKFKSKLVLHTVCSFFIESDLYNSIYAIHKGIDDYNSALSLHEPLTIVYGITVFIVALFIVFCAIWFGFYLSKTIVIPIMRLLDGTRRIAEGDLTFTIEKTPYDDEIGSLVDSFNKMVRDFLASQKQLKLSAKKLKYQNKEIEERRRYTEMVLKNVSAGVITLDANGFVTTFNTSAEKMLSLKADDILYSRYNKLFSSKNLQFMGEILSNLDSNRGQIFEIPLRITIDGFSRSFLVSINSLQDDRGKHTGVVMVFDDLTELEKAQRMAAWREVARRIAHEVKNPLTPITLSAQRLRRKYSKQINEPVFVECIHMIIDHVDLIRNLVDEFSTFARFPTAKLKPCKLPPIVEETVALYKEGHANIKFDIIIKNYIPEINIDRQQFKRVMINLADNAISALKNKGNITIKINYNSISRFVHIEVADNGPGIKDKDKIRLFEPNFSTKKSGLGLGLTIVNSIITDHNGMIRVQDNNPKGAIFIIELPV